MFSQLNTRTSSVWSFLLASGYLKAVKYFFDPEEGRAEYELALTNKEVRFMFEYMIEGWFSDFSPAYNEKQYEAGLIAKGIPAERIRKYGFAFEGKKVLIG